MSTVCYIVLYSGFTVSKLVNALTFSTFNFLATNTTTVALVIKINYFLMRLRIIDTQNSSHCSFVTEPPIPSCNHCQFIALQ